MKEIPKIRPEANSFLRKKKKIPSSSKKRDGISDCKIEVNKKNVCENAKNDAAIREVISSKKFFEIRYVSNMQAALRPIVRMFPNKTGSIPIFQKKPSITGHTSGLEGSHNPDFPAEDKYLPIPRYTEASHHKSAGNSK